MPPRTSGQMASSYAPDPSTTYLDGGGGMSPQQGPGPGMRALPGGGGSSRHGGSGQGAQQPLMMPPIMDIGMGPSGIGMVQQQQQQPGRMLGNLGSGGDGSMGLDGAMGPDAMLSGMEGGAGAPRRGGQRNGDQAAPGQGAQGPGFAVTSVYTTGPSSGVGGSVTQQQSQQQQPMATAKDPLLQMRIRREYCRQRAQLEEVMVCPQVVGQEAYAELDKTLKRIGAEVALLPLDAQPSVALDPRPAALTATAHVPSTATLSSRMRRFALAELLLDDTYWSSAHMAATLAAAAAAGAGSGQGGCRSAAPFGLGSEEHQLMYSQGLRSCQLAQEKWSALPWCRSGKDGAFFLTEAQQSQGLF
ncbi:hypothetical protein Vretimale_12698 [Volvox reticuliferus]|nr:hypothetical protein Vretifemale_25 [Volvox reticuliferus]GIM08696.1 hypothetical protein Vretimale_12698 [Volvox reticuliferus]